MPQLKPQNINQIIKLIENYAKARTMSTRYSTINDEEAYQKALRDNFTLVILGLELALEGYREYLPNRSKD